MTHEAAILRVRPDREIGPPMMESLLDWAFGLAESIPRVVRDGLAEGRYGGKGAM